MSDGKSTGFGPQPSDRKHTMPTAEVKNVVANSDLKQVVRKPNV